MPDITVSSPGQKTAQERRHDRGAVSAQGIFACAQTPVVQQGAFRQGVKLDHLIDTCLSVQFSGFLSLGNDSAEQLIIGPVVVQQVLFAGGDQLGGEKAGQQVQGYAVLNHSEKFAV